MKDKVKVWIENNFLKLKVIRLLYDKTIVRYRLYKKHKDFINYNTEILERLSDAFKELNLLYWLDFGTLLGAIREKRFIGHDLDIDIGVLGTFKEEERDRILSILLKYGFKRKYYFEYNNIIREETYDYKGVPIDLFYYEKKDMNIIGYYFLSNMGESREKTIKKRGGLIPIQVTFPFSGVIEYKFLGITTYIPKNFKNYIISRYGKNYTEKVVQWNNRTSPLNIKVLENELGYYYKT